jgi:hypothetical protein
VPGINNRTGLRLLVILLPNSITLSQVLKLPSLLVQVRFGVKVGSCSPTSNPVQLLHLPVKSLTG